jgi:hypothetical protein
MTTTVELARTDVSIVGLCGETIVIYYEQTPSMEAIRVEAIAMTRALTWLTQAVVLIVIEPGARAPAPAVRAEIQRTIQGVGDKVKASAYVILGGGFANAAVRAAVSGMLLYARPPFPTKAFATTRSAMAWLRSYTASADDESQLARLYALERFCSPAAVGLHQPVTPRSDLRDAV